MGSLLKTIIMKFLVLVLVFVGSLAEDPPVDSNQRYFGGIFNDFFGNHNQCNNCRYNYYQAEQCCQNGLDYNCCQYVNGSNGNYYPGNNNPGSNGNYNKPGVCPSSNYYGRNEGHRKQHRKQLGIGPEIPEVLMSHVQITEIMDYIGIIKIIIKIMVLAIRTEIAQDHKNVAVIAMALQFVNIPIIMAVAKIFLLNDVENDCFVIYWF